MDIGLRQSYKSRRNLLAKRLNTYSQKPDLRAYLELFLSLITIIVFGVFAIRPTIITIGKLLKEIKSKEETLGIMNQKIENLKTAQEVYNKNKDKIEIAKASVPDEPSPHSLVRQIEAASLDSSTTLSSLSVSAVDLVGDTGTADLQNSQTSLADENVLSISITAQGEFDRLLSFANELENLRRPIRLNEIGMGMVSEEKVNTLQLSLNHLTLPYLKSKQ
jgi:Tfp pilus assembly protein PilO